MQAKGPIAPSFRGAAIRAFARVVDALGRHARNSGAARADLTWIPGSRPAAGPRNGSRYLARFTNARPATTSATAAIKGGVTGSPSTRWPAATPNSGARKVKAETRLAE